MFLNSIAKALADDQAAFLGKTSLAKLQSMPTGTVEERLMLLLETMTFDKSLGITPLADGHEIIPNVTKIRNVIAEANGMSHNQTVMRHALSKVAQELSFEIFKSVDGAPDYSKICAIRSGELPAEAFMSVGNEKTVYTAVYAFVGASGKHYKGKGPIDLAKLTTDDYNDFLPHIPLEGEDAELRDKLIANPEAAKKEFMNFRNAMMYFTKYLLDPKKSESKVVTFLRKL